MIKIRLLGRIKKICGSSNIILEESEVSISSILVNLRKIAGNADEINQENLAIIINDVDSSLLPPNENVIKSGDTVIIASMIHGG